MMNIQPEKIQKLKRLLSNKPRTVIVTHINPDGDAIGSSLAMSEFLKQNEIPVTVIVPNRFPESFAGMQGSADIIVYTLNKDVAEKALQEAELLFCMDFNHLSRLEEFGKYIDSLGLQKVLVDHHLNPDESAYNVAFSDVTVSSTAELTYRIIIEYTGSTVIPVTTAEHIYTGIVSDTNVFSHNVTPEVFRLTANLLECGIDRDKIHQNIFRNRSEQSIRLNGFSIYERMKVMHQQHAAYIYLTLDELNKFAYQPGDTEGLVNIPLNIKGIILSAFFTENVDGSVKVSLRSTGSFSVNELSNKYFNGGGHRNAAGGKLFMSMDEAIKYFENVVENHSDIIAGHLTK